MKITKFNVPIYDWNIWFVDYSDGVMEKKGRRTFDNLCKRLSVGSENKTELEGNVFDGYGGGDCYTQPAWQRMIVMIGKMKSHKMRLRILNHEKRHAVDDILEWANIHDAEAAGFLDGYLSQFIK